MIFSPKRMQELSTLTFQASIDDNIEMLREIRDIIETPHPDGLRTIMGSEWFYSLITHEQMFALSLLRRKKNKK